MDILILIIILLFSVIIHEVAHGYAALAQGDRTAEMSGRLTLNPISHIDLFGSIIIPGLLILSGTGLVFGWAKPVPFNPYNLRNQKWGEALVALAGPASNLLIAFVFGLFIRFSEMLSLSMAVVEIFLFIVVINVVLVLFNLVPIPPLDGSKILFAVLPYKYMQVRHALERFGILFVVIFVLFFWESIALPLINLLMWVFVGFPVF
jgi:Zn-dependent protease